eukprot:SAG11_NODE_3180_length_2628_cov_7.505733_4_plen_52_part_00
MELNHHFVLDAQVDISNNDGETAMDYGSDHLKSSSVVLALLQRTASPSKSA